MKKHHKGRSLFQLIDKKSFAQLVGKWDMDKGVRGFTTWEMTHALMSCFVLRLGSYRDIEATLGIADSTFGDALRRRSAGFFQELCDLVLMQIRAKTENRKIKKAIRHILAIDSTEIQVHGSLFDEPGWKQKHCKSTHKAFAKLHVVWNVNGEWIDDFVITPGRRNDSPVSLELRILPGKVYVFDRAYNDFSLWEKIISAKSHFVTRLKDYPRNRYLQMKVLRKAKSKDAVLYDGTYRPTAPRSQAKNIKLRHVIYRDKLTKKIFHFVCSDFKISAKAIADIYKKRWAVELLFRWLKGHLDIRRLPTKTKNAVKIMLAAAVLFQLLLQLKKITDKFQGTLWDLLRAIRSVTIQKSLLDTGPPDGCRWNSMLAAGSRL
jgi:hypothetical protein